MIKGEDAMGIMKKTNTPRRKRYNQKTRLQRAQDWLSLYKGKNIVRGYSKWFGVDLVCAMKELEMLGHKIDEQVKQQIKQSLEDQQNHRKRQVEKKQKQQDIAWKKGNETFSFICGYTSNGFPFPITYEEMDRMDLLKEESKQEKKNTYLEQDDLPF